MTNACLRRALWRQGRCSKAIFILIIVAIVVIPHLCLDRRPDHSTTIKTTIATRIATTINLILIASFHHFFLSNYRMSGRA
jgi:hypothetical protein